MARQKSGEKKGDPLGGWPQFTTQKVKMVNDFISAREMSKNRPTDTDKGKHAEAFFRKWLEDFLPAKYGATSGYIISQGDSTQSSSALEGKLRHYDVIIYNRLESPILWTEISPDHSHASNIRAIPAEYVHGVLEVKSSFNARSITEAHKKLSELTPLLDFDEPDEQYKRYIPANFYMGLVCFALPEKEQQKLHLVNRFKPSAFPRGFHGGVILSADGLDPRNTGLLTYYPTLNRPTYLAQYKGETLIPQDGGIWSDSQEVSPGKSMFCMLTWSESNFARFAFELLGTMNGTYKPGTLDSFYGIRARIE